MITAIALYITLVVLVAYGLCMITLFCMLGLTIIDWLVDE